MSIPLDHMQARAYIDILIGMRTDTVNQSILLLDKSLVYVYV